MKGRVMKIPKIAKQNLLPKVSQRREKNYFEKLKSKHDGLLGSICSV